MTQLSTPSPLAAFPVVIEIPVQWGEQDLFGHVNHVVFFRWLESARMVYLVRTELAMALLGSGLGAIMASAKCDYRQQVKYPDTVLIGARIDRIGRSSVQMIQAVYSQSQGQIVAEAEAIVVAFDYRTQASAPVPDSIRALLEAFEGKPLPKPVAKV